MKRALTRIAFATVLLLTTQQLFAQTKTLNYHYDITGNRIERNLMLGGADPAPARKGAFSRKDSLGKIGLTIFPNPTEGLIKITMDNYIEGVPAATISVYDLSGKLIIQKQGITGSTELDLSPFARGAYLLRLNAGENISVWNIIKE